MVERSSSRHPWRPGRAGTAKRIGVPTRPPGGGRTMNVFMTLLRERIRRDRWQLLVWIVGTALLAYVTYVGVSESYGTQRDREALLATAIANPVIMLFRGLPSGAVLH